MCVLVQLILQEFAEVVNNMIQELNVQWVQTIKQCLKIKNDATKWFEKKLVFSEKEDERPGHAFLI